MSIINGVNNVAMPTHITLDPTEQAHNQLQPSFYFLNDTSELSDEDLFNNCYDCGDWMNVESDNNSVTHDTIPDHIITDTTPTKEGLIVIIGLFLLAYFLKEK